MRMTNWLLAVFLAATLGLAGCGGTKPTVDTAPLETNFKSAESALQASANKAVAAIKAQDYPSAVAELNKLVANAKLTPAQQQAVKDTLAQVQKAFADAASKMQGEATKAATDLQKSLPK